MAPSCGVAVPDPGADVGGEGPGDSVGGATGLPVSIALTCARTRGPAGSGAVNVGTRAAVSGARIDRAATVSGVGADLITDVSVILASVTVALDWVGLSVALLASPVNAVCIGRCSPVALISVFLVNLLFPLGAALPMCSSAVISTTGRRVVGSFNAFSY